jgi:hypothetical protein
MRFLAEKGIASNFSEKISENSDRTLATSHEGKAATRSGHIRRIHAEVQTHCRQSVSS